MKIGSFTYIYEKTILQRVQLKVACGFRELGLHQTLNSAFRLRSRTAHIRTTHLNLQTLITHFLDTLFNTSAVRCIINNTYLPLSERVYACVYITVSCVDITDVTHLLNDCKKKITVLSSDTWAHHKKHSRGRKLKKGKEKSTTESNAREDCTPGNMLVLL